MTTLSLYYATNRNHEGDDRWKPDGYGKKFSDDGMENLRFGYLTVDTDDATIARYAGKNMKEMGIGDGESLGAHLEKCAVTAKIQAYQEKLNPDLADTAQKNAVLGSLAMFADLKADMKKCSDVLLYIHGFNVTWHEAVGYALALQLMLNNSPAAAPKQQVMVVLFTWPSDGLALPFTSYKSDRSEATGSGNAVGRGILKVRDFMVALRDKTKTGEKLCGQDIHLLCHSMGNYLLQSAIERLNQFTPGAALPRIFEHIFLCAPDVDDTALEQGCGLSRVHEIARGVTIYHNRGDMAMVVSDYTKGNPERLGGGGAARPSLLHNKVQQVDCTPVVSGLVEHCYYLSGCINADIRQSIDNVPYNDPQRRRSRDLTLPNVWRMR